MTGMMDMGGPAGPMVGRSICDWPMMAALLLIFGLATFAATFPPSEIAPRVLPRRLSTVIRLCALVQFVVSPLVLLVNVASMAQVGLSAAIPLVPEVLHETHFGQVWLLSAPLAVLLVVLAWIPSSRERVRAGGLALISAALLLLCAASGHAVDYGRTAIGVYFVHEAAVGLWFGSLVALWLAFARTSDTQGFDEVVARVSKISAGCVGALVLTGLYSAYKTLGLNPDHLLFSVYGRTLLLKSVLFGLVVAMGGYNHYRLMPHTESPGTRRSLLRNTGVESVFLIGVLGLAVLLANTSPPH